MSHIQHRFIDWVVRVGMGGSLRRFRGTRHNLIGGMEKFRYQSQVLDHIVIKTALFSSIAIWENIKHKRRDFSKHAIIQKKIANK